MKIELMWPEEAILEEIESGDFTRDEVALTYAFCIESRDNIDWKKINMAIRERWSRSAVKYIKREAWKLIREQEERK